MSMEIAMAVRALQQRLPREGREIRCDRATLMILTTSSDALAKDMSGLLHSIGTTVLGMRLVEDPLVPPEKAVILNDRNEVLDVVPVPHPVRA
jgi:hypothetical protein